MRTLPGPPPPSSSPLVVGALASQPRVHPSSKLLHPTVEVPFQRVGRFAPVWVGVIDITVCSTVGKDSLHVSKEEPTRGVVASGQLLRDGPEVYGATGSEERGEGGRRLCSSALCTLMRCGAREIGSDNCHTRPDTTLHLTVCCMYVHPE